MSPGEAWLRDRVGDAPPQLLETMIAALSGTDGAVPEVLATAAVHLYGQVAASYGGREDSLPLLAADALLTHAFQAQAEIDPDGLVALAERWSARGELGKVWR